MLPESDHQIPLQVTRGMLVTIAVVMGISWFGARGDIDGEFGSDPPGHAFGSWTIPDIRPLTGPSTRIEELGIRIDSADGFAFFALDREDEGHGSAAITFVHRKASILGEIKAFDPDVTAWPPEPIEFGPSINIQLAENDTTDEPVIEIGPSSDFQIQVQTILYRDATITWASPRKCPTWPLRIHIGRCELGDRTLRISIYEMDAKTPKPSYEAGPIADLAAALAPL